MNENQNQVNPMQNEVQNGAYSPYQAQPGQYQNPNYNQQQNQSNQRFNQPNYGNFQAQGFQQNMQNRPSPESIVANEGRAIVGNGSKDSGDLKINPQRIHFATQNPEEVIFVYVRRHWSENVKWIIRNFLYSLLPLITYLILDLINVELGFLNNTGAIVVIFSYYSLILTNCVKDFADWYFDPYIFTNERVIHFEFKPFGRYVVKETMLQSVQKIREKAGGVLSNFFGYGTLVVTIEGPQEELHLNNVPEPTELRNILSDLVKVAKRYYGDSTG